MRGCHRLASSSSSQAKLMMVRRSPGLPKWDVAPLRMIAPEPGLAGNGVGLKALAVGQVAGQDFFVGQQAGLLHQGPVNGQAALVIEVAPGDFGPMNFRF